MVSYRISPILLFLLLVSFVSCSKKISLRTVASISELEKVTNRSAETKDPCDCGDAEHYIPRQELEVIQDLKFVKTVYVFPNSLDRSHNWTGEDMVYYAKNLNRIGNDRLVENTQMKLPEGNSTPVYSIPWRYKMYEDETTDSGLAIYEALDDDLYYYVTRGANRNNSDKRVIRKFQKFEEEAINVFAMSHHPDSIASETYSPWNVGISMGTSVKIAGVLQTDLKGVWKMATLYNHEMGHTMGLRHSWYKRDGCDDTPPHPNCYTAKPSGECKGPISNNMMDYNHAQVALTPCQIGIATKYLHSASSRLRTKVVKDWCDKSEIKSLVVRDSLHLDRHADLKGDILIQDGGTLKISCVLNMPKNGKIIVHHNGTLILNGCTIRNDCGDSWDGIELLQAGSNKASVIKLGVVTLEDLNKS